MLDWGLTAAGYRSLVLACEGSRGAGTLVTAGKSPDRIDDAARSSAWSRWRSAIEDCLERWRVDLIHFHGIDFHRYLPAGGPTKLVTLHLPLDHYPPEVLTSQPPATWYHCVSQLQHQNRAIGANFLPPIENAAPIEPPSAFHTKRRFAVFLGRICPEKGIHLAIEAVRQAKVPLISAGHVFPYESHLRYFHENIEPCLGTNCRLSM